MPDCFNTSVYNCRPQPQEFKAAKKLIQAGAEVNIYMGSEDALNPAPYPLHKAVLLQNRTVALEMVKEIVENGGGDVNVKNNHNATPLTFAIANNRRDIVNYLKEKGGKQPCPINEETGNIDCQLPSPPIQGNIRGQPEITSPGPF